MSSYGVILDPHISQSTPASRKDDYKTAIFGKISWIVRQANERNWKALVVAGDFFSVKPFSWQSLVELVGILKECQCPIYVIPGNHDLYYERLDSLPKTPLGLLYEAGLVHNFGVIEDGLFTGLPFSADMQIPNAPKREGHTVLVCHAFLGNNELEGSGSDWLYYPDIINAGYSVVVAGHDHAPYPAYTPTGTNLLVLRPGSISRGTKHIINRNRQPFMLVMTFKDDDTVLEYEYLEIPAAKPQDIFSEIQIERESLNKSIKDFAARLEEVYANGGVEETDLKKLIDSMTIPADVKQVLLQYLLDAGIVL